jgi:hypothetical protein
VYLAVLGVAMIASMIGVAALHVERTNLRAAAGRDDVARAQAAASSAVELAFTRIKADPNWRSTYVHGVEVPLNGWTPMGDLAKFKFALIDADGSLVDNVNDVNDGNDPVTIRGIGAAGDVTCVTTVVIEPGQRGLNCLEVRTLHAGGRLRFENDSTLATDQFISSNDRIEVQAGILNLFLIEIGGSHVNGAAWSTGSISNRISQRFPNQSPAREMPDAAAVFDHYLRVGTRIDIASIPSRTLRRVVLSANSNPYGAANPQGIYIIDCAGQQLTIRDARIQATLVLLNASATPQILGRIHWEPSAPNYPALMVQGSLHMNWDGEQDLSEATNGVSYNPVGTPYLNSQDADTSDNYPGVIQGLVYMTGNFTVDKRSKRVGTTIVGGTATFTASSTLTYDSAPYNYPPPGFGAAGQMRVMPGSWRRATVN